MMLQQYLVWVRYTQQSRKHQGWGEGFVGQVLGTSKKT